MTINEAMTALWTDYHLPTEVPNVLAQPLTLALVWLDLCRLVGEEPLTAVLALAETSIAAAAD